MTDMESIGHQAGVVAVINMTPFYLGPHLLYAADWLNMPLSTFKSIHPGASLSFIVVAAIHIAAFKAYQSRSNANGVERAI